MTVVCHFKNALLNGETTADLRGKVRDLNLLSGGSYVTNGMIDGACSGVRMCDVKRFLRTRYKFTERQYYENYKSNNPSGSKFSGSVCWL